MPLLLDTVTISAFRRESRTPPSVLEWSSSLEEPCHYLSVISLNEICYGLRLVEKRDPDFGKKLFDWYQGIISQSQYYRILPVDRKIAEVAAQFRADLLSPYYDSLIAATAKVHGLTLATRNTADFEATGIALVNPWKFQPKAEDE